MKDPVAQRLLQIMQRERSYENAALDELPALHSWQGRTSAHIGADRARLRADRVVLCTVRR
jgi:hypothetical protein